MRTASVGTAALHLLDRASATPGPVWETDPADRTVLSEALGPLELDVTVRSDGSAQAAGDLLVAAMVVIEAALAELSDRGLGREEAMFVLRQRVDDVLGDGTAEGR